jgi:hypothetical protein
MPYRTISHKGFSTVSSANSPTSLFLRVSFSYVAPFILNATIIAINIESERRELERGSGRRTVILFRHLFLANSSVLKWFEAISYDSPIASRYLESRVNRLRES